MLREALTFKVRRPCGVPSLRLRSQPPSEHGLRGWKHGHPAGGRRECEAGQEGTVPGRRGRSSMELRRFFRAPVLLIAVAVLLLLFVLDYANSGSTYKQVDTSKIVQLIDQGKVKSALLVDKNQTIQITTKSGQNLEASWVSGQGLQLQNKLQDQFNKGN